MLSFIESQFPVSRLSKESYLERVAVQSQTLTGLGKWWGRKPLILCRATIIGLLLPATNNPERDREIFLKILTMDTDGLLRRWTKRYTVAELGLLATPVERREWSELDGHVEATAERVARLRNDSKQIARGDKEAKAVARAEIESAIEDVNRAARGLNEFLDALQTRVFLRQPYEDQINRCARPEQIDGPSEAAWTEINSHLGTTARNLAELVSQLGQKRFGHTPTVGDAFCGGGSIPFEAARIGCDAYGSDNDPVAALLTWAALNIVGGGAETAEQIRETQERIYAQVDRQITSWGIEHRTEDIDQTEWMKLVAKLRAGEITTTDIHHAVPRADAYLYCVEVTCPETGWQVPLLPTLVIGPTSRCVAKLVPDVEKKRYDIVVETGVTDAELLAAREGTIKSGLVIHPILKEQGKDPASIDQIRLAGRGKDKAARYHENGLRLWENEDVVPRTSDALQERLFCVRWVVSFQRENSKRELVWDTRKEYRAPTEHDLKRDSELLRILYERFNDWQRDGRLPSMAIASGAETDRLQRERGWTRWHHLFHPRQLLLHGEFIEQGSGSPVGQVALLLGVGRACDWNSRLCRWGVGAARESGAQTYYNQALNTLNNYLVKGLRLLEGTSIVAVGDQHTLVSGSSSIVTHDARTITQNADLWVTDPPYADAVNYHELSPFFLAWYGPSIKRLFPQWHQARTALAVTGSDDNFRRSMVDCYRNLANHMPDDGMQVVMFTHQDAAVWADLALILWAAGLRVTAAWCIATETDTKIKEGNYVQGTVLLVLRKQTSNDSAFMDEVYPQVEVEVKRQLDALHDLDEAHATSPDFADTDYQLAAYAAALRILTQYARIEDIDVERELSRQRKKNEKSELEKLIDNAVRIACDHLVPAGFDRFVWKTLSPMERFYLKGLDLESHAEFRSGAYQELARGFGLRDYKDLLGSEKANEVRLRTATGFGRKLISGAEGGDPFADSLTRQVLFAVKEVAASDEGSAEPGIIWLKSEVKNFWANRKAALEILRYLARLEHTVAAWEKDGRAAHILAGAVENMPG